MLDQGIGAESEILISAAVGCNPVICRHICVVVVGHLQVLDRFYEFVYMILKFVGSVPESFSDTGMPGKAKSGIELGSRQPS